MTEEWRAVVGYEGQYEVSNLGRVRSLDRTAKIRGGSFRAVKGQELKPLNHSCGYLAVSLGHRNQKLIHVLVAEAFLGPRPGGSDVRHLDGDPRNNWVSNLSYGTRSENMRDVARYDKEVRGRINNDTLLEIRRRLALGEPCNKIAEDLSVGDNVVYKIKSGKTFSYIK